MQPKKVPVLGKCNRWLTRNTVRLVVGNWAFCYDKREELLPGGNSPGAAEYIQIYYNPFRPVFPQKPADFVQKEFAL